MRTSIRARAAALFLAAACLVAPASGQQMQRPPFQAVVEAWLEVIADPTAARVSAFAERHLAPAFREAHPPEWHVARAREMGAVLGRAELLNLVYEVDGERRGVFRSGVDGEVAAVIFKVTGDTPPKIAGMALQGLPPAGPPAGRDAAASVTPETRAAQFLDAAFAAEPPAAEAWLRGAYAPGLFNAAGVPQHLAFLAQVRDEMREIELVRTTAPSATEGKALYRSRLTGEWRELTVQVEPAAPNRIASVSRALVAPPASHAPEVRKLSSAEAKTALDTYARRLAEADLFSGSVLVARGESVVFEGVYGKASREFGVDGTRDTRFGLGSINKMFTAVGILQLVEQGKLSLTDTVAQHLSGVLPADAAAAIRVEHLLTHTSGLGDFIFTPQMQNRARPNYRTIADHLALIADMTPRFEPGTAWGYSNAGFLVLGAILERVSGMPYDDYIQRHVFDPPGMTQSGPVDVDLVPMHLATAYQREFDGSRPRLRSDRFLRPVRTTPAGGGYSTAADLRRFMTALRGHTLLSPEMTRRMLSPKPELNSPDYGFGAQIFSPGGTRVGHTGGGWGTSASVEYDAEHDLLFIVLGNMNTGAAAVRARARQVYGAGEPRQSW